MPPPSTFIVPSPHLPPPPWLSPASPVGNAGRTAARSSDHTRSFGGGTPAMAAAVHHHLPQHPPKNPLTATTPSALLPRPRQPIPPTPSYPPAWPTLYASPEVHLCFIESVWPYRPHPSHTDHAGGILATDSPPTLLTRLGCMPPAAGAASPPDLEPSHRSSGDRPFTEYRSSLPNPPPRLNHTAPPLRCSLPTHRRCRRSPPSAFLAPGGPPTNHPLLIPMLTRPPSTEPNHFIMPPLHALCAVFLP